MTTNQFDVVIAGGGMAGSSLARALLQTIPQISIAIVEQQAEPVSKASFDSRSIALAAASCQLLAKWQLWRELKPNACAIKQIMVSDRGHFGKTSLTAAEYQLDALGFVIEVEHIGALLAEKLTQCTKLTRFTPNVIAKLQPTLDAQHITLDDGTALSAKLLVIAEGGLSPTRALAGFSFTEQPYGQQAIIANLALSEPHRQQAFERFTAHGPIALLPLTEQRYSLVYTAADHSVADLMQLDDAAFVAHVQQAFGYRAGIFTASGKRACYPLSLRLSGDIVRHRVALLGNSLHNLHPIAGQGFNLALRDIAQLVAQIQAQPEAIGSYAMLRAYQQQRSKDIATVSTATDALVRLFSNQSRTIALARNAGLLAMTLCDELKRPLAEQAMGFRS